MNALTQKQMVNRLTDLSIDLAGGGIVSATVHLCGVTSSVSLSAMAVSDAGKKDYQFLYRDHVYLDRPRWEIKLGKMIRYLETVKAHEGPAIDGLINDGEWVL